MRNLQIALLDNGPGGFLILPRLRIFERLDMGAAAVRHHLAHDAESNLFGCGGADVDAGGRPDRFSFFGGVPVAAR